MNTQDDPRFAGLTFPREGFVIDYFNDAPPEVRSVLLLEYSLSDPGCSIKTILYRNHRRPEPGTRSERVRCSVDMIFLSVAEATEHIRKEMEDAVVLVKEDLARRVEEAADQLKRCKDWLRNNPRP